MSRLKVLGVSALRAFVRKPWLYALGAALLASRLPQGFVVNHDEYVKELLLAAINVGAIAFGFIMTAQSVIMAIAKDRVLDDVRRLGFGHQLVDLFGSCVHFYFVSIAYSMAFLMALNVERLQSYLDIVLAGLAFLAGGSLAASWRLFALYQEILRQQLS